MLVFRYFFIISILILLSYVKSKYIVIDVSTAYQSVKNKINMQERNLLSVAFKNQVGTKRSSWRIISNMEHKEDLMKNTSVKYMCKISKEIETTCNSVVVCFLYKLFYLVY